MPPSGRSTRPGVQQAYPQLPMRKRIDLAARGLLFFVTLGLAFVLALATPPGHAIDMLQGGGPGGMYSPKLTFLVVLIIAAVPMVIVYFERAPFPDRWSATSAIDRAPQAPPDP